MIRRGIGGFRRRCISLYSLSGPQWHRSGPAARSPIPASGLPDGVLAGIKRTRARHSGDRVVPVARPDRGTSSAAIFQPFAVATFLMSAVLARRARCDRARESIRLFVRRVCRRCSIGTWLGMRRFSGKLDEAMFRKVVLVLLLISGAALMRPSCTAGFAPPPVRRRLLREQQPLIEVADPDQHQPEADEGERAPHAGEARHVEQEHLARR